MNAYYNEIDAEKAAWIRELIKAGAVAPGEVDERSIKDVQPDDLRGFSQCHFFAGIAVWSYGLRLAGWPDDRECWTGSCPCPSFSAAGKGQGFADARHLWPDWMRLIRECKPSVVFGEQVEAAIGHGWLDLVQTDLENETYAVGKAVLGACSVGAPHRRQRLYFVGLANAEHPRLSRAQGSEAIEDRDESGLGIPERDGGESERMDDAKRTRLEGFAGDGDDGNESGWLGAQPSGSIAETGGVGRLANIRALGCRRRERTTQGRLDDGEVAGRREGDDESIGRNEVSCTASPFSHTLKGFWRDADWLFCRDGRWRPVEPGTFPLATGTPASLGRLRGYGDALNAQTAKEFIEAVMN